MPELPEVEVVRLGLLDHVVGRTITGVMVHDARSLRRHLPGPARLRRSSGRSHGRRRPAQRQVPVDAAC
ncbi:DNA-formamidopyrimidine glycosylase family protein [Aeromicrobium sp. UC242_57]|uniref:DNA-formamidopyrimidine glycosylase family protein n=1 Tax=Aeromicrobium sp. UC242_57 TaxID=3374624 RepID=UPI0037B5CE7D